MNDVNTDLFFSNVINLYLKLFFMLSTYVLNARNENSETDFTIVMFIFILE